MATNSCLQEIGTAQLHWCQSYSLLLNPSAPASHLRSAQDTELLFKCERICQILGKLTQAQTLIQPLSTGFPTSCSKEGSALPVCDTTKPNQRHIQGFTWISVHCIAEFHRLDHRFVPDLLLSALINQHLKKHKDFTKLVLEYFCF